MRRGTDRRVLWALNHMTSRRFEIPMLKRLGFREFYLPKKFPANIGFRSADVDFSEDKNLTIPREDIAALNEVDWSRRLEPRIWGVINRHFDVLFGILNTQSFFLDAARHFKGAFIWRAYGLPSFSTYAGVLHSYTEGVNELGALGRRWWIGTAFDTLKDAEPQWLKDRDLFLPLGFPDTPEGPPWVGDDARIFFVCPEIAFNPYYMDIYRDFKRDYGDLAYVVAGSQPIATEDPHALGFLSREDHLANMRRFRVMFYSSREPRHLHYHPFEAIHAGMPLIFMGGGLLDRLGGRDLPGRCASVREARKKLARVLAGDDRLIQALRSTQGKLMEPMRPDACEPEWRKAFDRITAELDRPQQANPAAIPRRKKIAVILPERYRGGTLRGAMLLARSLASGSAQAGEAADVVFGHVDASEYRTADRWADLPDTISRRPFRWRRVEAELAHRIMRFAGHPEWKAKEPYYVIPDDRMQQFTDCDFWMFVSDRVGYPLLPLRRHAVVVYDYAQRYAPVLKEGVDGPFRRLARTAEKVLCTTRFTREDALQYAGIHPDRVVCVPMLTPERPPAPASAQARPYFLWSTNGAAHKNHSNAMEALRLYYGTLDGRLGCCVTNLSPEAQRALVPSDFASERMSWLGELPDPAYQATLTAASFLWHPARVDNGSFSVVEAAHLGVPSLSSDYPAMREMDQQFSLGLHWMDSDNPRDMAQKLKWMEHHLPEARARVPSADTLASKRVEALAAAYWKVIRECL